MTDTEIIAKLTAQNEKLLRKVKRLEKRLLEKKAFETMDLEQKGATAQFIARIDAKDRAALAD